MLTERKNRANVWCVIPFLFCKSDEALLSQHEDALSCSAKFKLEMELQQVYVVSSGRFDHTLIFSFPPHGAHPTWMLVQLLSLNTGVFPSVGATPEFVRLPFLCFRLLLQMLCNLQQWKQRKTARLIRPRRFLVAAAFLMSLLKSRCYWTSCSTSKERLVKESKDRIIAWFFS